MKKIYLIPILSIFLLCCKKEQGEKTIKISSEQKTIGAPIPSYDFDWETATYMPSASNSNQVPMPWNSGTTAIDANIVSDYKKVDGWRLAYNSFNPTTLLNDQNYTYYFGLYNEFRGLLRVYLWHPSSTVATEYVTHELSLYGNSLTSNMLQFNGADNIELTNLDQNGFKVIQKQPFNSAGGTWYVFQYEISYDPNISTSTFPNTGLTWKSSWTNVTNFNLLGTTTGTLKGTIGSPSTGFNFGSFLTKSALNFAGDLGLSSFLDLISSDTTSTNIQKSITNAQTGLVKGFLNGLLGISGGAAPAPISLTMNTTTKIEGSSITNGGMVNNKLILPGQQNSLTANGITPHYDKVMGLFTLSSKPNVTQSGQSFQIPNDDPIYGGYTNYEDLHLSLDPTSVQFIWNTAIVNSNPNGVTISNIKKEVVIIGGSFVKATGNSISEYGSINFGSVLVFNNSFVENYLDTKLAVGPQNTTQPLKIGYNYNGANFSNNIGVRISFDVTSNNDNLKKATIVKTFVPNVIHQ